MKKILFITDNFGIGGAEKLLVNIIWELKMYEIHMIVLGEPITLLSELPSHCKVTVLKFKSYSNILEVIYFIRSYIKKYQIDILHSQLFWSNIISRLSSNGSIKVFNTIQAISSEASYKINKLSLYLEKITYRKRHHIISVSKEVERDFDKWIGLKGPSTVMFNIIDEKYFTSEPKSSFTNNGLKMVAVGNLRWQKNYPYIFKAFESMPRNVSLDIFGEGDLRKEFQKIIDKKQLNIRLCGLHNNLEKKLLQYDIFVMSSLYEGFSLSLMEAMALGLPLFLSDIPVLYEAAMESAVYFKLDNPLDLVEKVTRVLNNETDLIALAKASQMRSQKIGGKKAYIEKLIAIYDNNYLSG